MENEDQLIDNHPLEQVNKEEESKLDSKGNPSEPIVEANPPEPAIPPLMDQGGKKSRKVIFLAIAAIVVLSGAAAFYFLYLCHPRRQVLATVNGEKITVEQFNQEIGKVENPMQDMLREEPDKLLEGIIAQRLLLQEAKKQGLSAPVKTYKDNSKDAVSLEDSLISEFMKKKFSSPPSVTREEIETFYAIAKDKMEGKPLKDVAPMIEQVLQQWKQKREVEQFIGDLRKNAKVEIDQNLLKKIAAKPPESNTEEDFKKAMTSGKPVLVDFGANSCVPCRQMRPILKEVNAEYSEKAKVLVIDVYKFQDLARQYKVQLIPTLVFFNSKGQEVFRHLGVLDKEKIVAKLKEIGMGT
jgi:thioredoxin 1